MKKAEFVKLVAEALEVSQKDASDTLDKVFGVIEDSLVEHGEVPLGNLGKLVVNERAERNGRNPASGEAIVIPSAKVPKFKASKHLKETVNK